jgi:hypothetical protein
LPLKADKETSFIDEIVDKVLPLNPFGLDLAIKAVKMTGNHETWMKILEKPLDEQSKRSAEICSVFLKKFGGDKMFSN